MHPAYKIITQVEALLTTSVPGVRVFVERSETLGPGDDLPALIVSMGQDALFASATTMDKHGGLLSFSVDIVDVDADEKNLIARLMEYRRLVHKALMTDTTLALSFVIEVAYNGADKPRSNKDASLFGKQLTTQWQVIYLSDRVDPNV